MVVNSQLHVLGGYTPGEIATGTHYIQSCVGHRTSAEEMARGKIPCLCQE